MKRAVNCKQAAATLWIIFVGLTCLTGVLFAVVLSSAASAVLWGPMTTAGILGLGILAFIGLADLPSAKPPARAVNALPDGFVMVPVKPTEEVINAMCAAKLRRLNRLAAGEDNEGGILQACLEDYAAMLTAVRQENIQQPEDAG